MTSMLHPTYTALQALDELMRRCREDDHTLTYKDLQALRDVMQPRQQAPAQRPGDVLPGGAYE